MTVPPPPQGTASRCPQDHAQCPNKAGRVEEGAIKAETLRRLGTSAGTHLKQVEVAEAGTHWKPAEETKAL